jgi:hypothetical protein
MLRQFAGAWLVFFTALALKAGVLRSTKVGWLLAGLALIGGMGLVAPRSVRALFVVASAVAFPIGWLVSQLVLALMFFGVLTPLALWFRLRRRDPLQLRKRSAPTFWIDRGPPLPPERYLKQF